MPKLFSDDYKIGVLSCLSALKVYQLSRFPHNCHPSNALYLNENDDDDSDEEKDDFDSNSSLSSNIRTNYPVCLNNITDVNELVNKNLVQRLIQRKNQYLYDISKLTTLFLNFNKSKKGKEFKADDIYSTSLYLLIKMAYNDPDPYFFGAYNWYFTGGNLEIITIGDVDFLFHVTGPNMDVFNSSRIDAKDNDQLEIQRLDKAQSTVDSTSDSTIFEIVKSENDRYVAARQKHNFSIYYLDNECNQDSFSSDGVPFISGTFLCDNFLSIDVNRTIKQYNLVRRTDIGDMCVKQPTDNNYWCQLKAYNNHILFADDKTLQIYDNRLFGKNKLANLKINLGNVTEQCENVTCIETDPSENNVYVATTHNLFVFDIRNGKKKNGQMVRYRHQLQTSPFAIDASGGGVSGTTAHERLVVTAGSSVNDIVINQHSKVRDKEKLIINNLPQKVLTSVDSYHKSRQNGNLSKEIDDSGECYTNVNTGIRLIRKDSKLFLLTQQSSGQILYQRIKTRDELSMGDEKFDRDFSFNSNSFPDQSKTYRATTVTNFNGLKRIMNIKTSHQNERFENEKLPMNKWQKSIDQLSEYKDLLSTDMLSIWNVEMIRRNQDKPQSREIVDQWLSTSVNTGVKDASGEQEVPVLAW